MLKQYYYFYLIHKHVKHFCQQFAPKVKIHYATAFAANSYTQDLYYCFDTDELLQETLLSNFGKLCGTRKFADKLNVFTWSLLHELGHICEDTILDTLVSVYDEDERTRLNEENPKTDRERILNQLEYMNLPAEKTANNWAVYTFIRNAAKIIEFDKKIEQLWVKMVS